MPKKRWLAAAHGAAAVVAGRLRKQGEHHRQQRPDRRHRAGPTVSIMVGGLSKQIYLPYMLAQRLGYYQQEGLNVALQDEGAGVDATAQMLAGKVDGVGGFYDHTIDLQGLGQSAESVVSMLPPRARSSCAAPTSRTRSSRPPTGRAVPSASPTSAPRPTSSPSTSPRRTASTPPRSTASASRPARP